MSKLLMMVKIKKRQTRFAEPYRENALKVSTNAQFMLLRQYKFPGQYREDEKLITIKGDNPKLWDLKYFEKCFGAENVGKITFEYWVRHEDSEKIMAFLKKIIPNEEKIKWTGFRVMVHVYYGSVYFIWELFSHNKHGRTKVYSDDKNARNILN